MARYADALDWILDNDDTDWLDHDADDACGTESVTAALVADLFERSTKSVREDLLALRQARAKVEAQRQAKLRRAMAAKDKARATTMTATGSTKARNAATARPRRRVDMWLTGLTLPAKQR